MPKYAISLIGMKRPQGTRQCLERMLRLAPKDTHFFLTANGCPQTAAMFRTLKGNRTDITITENSSNLGFQKPHNAQFIAAAQMGCQYVLVANDDIEVPERFMELLSEPMECDGEVAITGPSGTCAYLNADFHGTGGSGPPHYIEGSLSLIRVETIRRLRNSLWCPGLRFVYSEDASLGLFVQEKGYKIAIVPMQVSHLRSVTVNGDPETKRICEEAQKANHELNRHRWAYWSDTHRFDIPIVLKRDYAIGDVILMEPIIRAVRKSRPLSPIYVQTNFPEVFAHHPDVMQGVCPHGPSLRVDLFGSYEGMAQTHIVDAYWQATAKVVTGLEPHDWVTRLHPSPEDVAWADARRKELGSDKLALLATDSTTWVSKNWPSDRMHQVGQWLVDNGWTVAAVGSKDRITPLGWRGVHNLVGQSSLMQLAALCGKAQLVITPDTSTLHLAQAMGCPVVGLFGVTRARYITTQGSRCAAVECPDHIPGAGARHKALGQTVVDVGNDVMLAITVDSVIEAVKKLEL